MGDLCADDPWLFALIAFEVGLIVGMLVAGWMRDSAWRSKASGQGSPVMCSGGRFYVVMTERDYVRKMSQGIPSYTRPNKEWP